jgi:hypothetical protein
MGGCSTTAGSKPCSLAATRQPILPSKQFAESDASPSKQYAGNRSKLQQTAVSKPQQVAANRSKPQEAARRQAQKPIEKRSKNASRESPLSKGQAIELGDIRYCNLSADGYRGDVQIAIAEAQRTGKPIFANFVEWPG